VRVIGLTGGIASGKSTVAAMLRELGAPIIDADLLARQVVEPGAPALAEIAQVFGPEVLAADGSLDRKRMGERIFADPGARAVLNAITHPRIAQASAASIADLAAGGHPVAIYEAALLVENRIHERLGGLIVVSVPPEIQLERLRARDGLDEDGARARVGAQLPLASKVAVADWVVDNGGPVAHTREQVERIWREIQEQAA
jgi:dephospho-CoA kinase